MFFYHHHKIPVMVRQLEHASMQKNKKKYIIIFLSIKIAKEKNEKRLLDFCGNQQQRNRKCVSRPNKALMSCKGRSPVGI